MGILNSKTVSMKEEEPIMKVKFIRIAKNENCNVTPDELHMLLGLNIPQYSIIHEKDTDFPYLFCVNTFVDIDSILRDYGYEIGFSVIQNVRQNQFNDKHTANYYPHYKIYNYTLENWR